MYGHAGIAEMSSVESRVPKSTLLEPADSDHLLNALSKYITTDVKHGHTSNLAGNPRA